MFAVLTVVQKRGDGRGDDVGGRGDKSRRKEEKKKAKAI